MWESINYPGLHSSTNSTWEEMGGILLRSAEYIPKVIEWRHGHSCRRLQCEGRRRRGITLW